jgi:diacylglycerol kinase (ATP)
MGIGIDAHIIKKYETYKKRTLIAYLKASILSSFQFKAIQTQLTFNNRIININSFLLFISNSNEMGYGMSLTPKASLQDGWLDLVKVSKLGFIDKLVLGMYVLSNKIEKFKKAEHTLIQKLSIEIPNKINTDIQIDGEFHNVRTNKVNVSIIKNGLEIIVG